MPDLKNKSIVLVGFIMKRLRRLTGQVLARQHIITMATNRWDATHTVLVAATDVGRAIPLATTENEL